MPSSKVDPELAALTAETSADEASKAAEQAVKDDLVAKRAAAGEPVCPVCHGELVKHGDDNPFKAGCSHCNTCGACWAPGLKRQRDGHVAAAKA